MTYTRIQHCATHMYPPPLPSYSHMLTHTLVTHPHTHLHDVEGMVQEKVITGEPLLHLLQLGLILTLAQLFLPCLHHLEKKEGGRRRGKREKEEGKAR